MPQEIKSKKVNIPIAMYHVDDLDRIRNSKPTFNVSREFLNALFDWNNKEYPNLKIETGASRGYVFQYIYVPSDKVLLFNQIKNSIKSFPRSDDTSKVKIGDIIMSVLKVKYGA